MIPVTTAIHAELPKTMIAATVYVSLIDHFVWKNKTLETKWVVF